MDTPNTMMPGNKLSSQGKGQYSFTEDEQKERQLVPSFLRRSPFHVMGYGLLCVSREEEGDKLGEG